MKLLVGVVNSGMCKKFDLFENWYREFINFYNVRDSCETIGSSLLSISGDFAVKNILSKIRRARRGHPWSGAQYRLYFWWAPHGGFIKGLQ